MLKKLLILGLFFQLVGFTPVFASQEPTSNGWGFGTFLAAGAALIGGFKLAVWGMPKIQAEVKKVLVEGQKDWAQYKQQQEERKKRDELHARQNIKHPEIADEMVKNITPQETLEWEEDHKAAQKRAKMSEFPVHIALDPRRIEINDTDQKQIEWVKEQRTGHAKWARIGFSAEQLQQAASENIPVHTATLTKINRLVLTSYFVDSQVHSLIRKFKMNPSWFRGGYGDVRGLVPLFTPPLLKYNNTPDSCELMNHLPKDVVGICDEYADGEISNAKILVNKRKLMLALGALSCRASLGLRFKNIHETAFCWGDDGDLNAYNKEDGFNWFEKGNPNWRLSEWQISWNRNLIYYKVPEWQINDEQVLWQLQQDAYAIRTHSGLE